MFVAYKMSYTVVTRESYLYAGLHREQPCLQACSKRACRICEALAQLARLTNVQHSRAHSRQQDATRQARRRAVQQRTHACA